MEKNIAEKTFRIQGMSCSGCEMRIENALRKIAGVVSAKASFSKAEVHVKYDPALTKPEKIIAAIEKLDYRVGDTPPGTGAGDKFSINQMLGIGIIIFAIYLAIKNTVGFNFIPQVDQSMGYGLLFLVGLLTSLHCIAMCGGINLSQSVSGKVSSDASRLAKFKPGLLYNAGRVISYTIIGGLAGALGSAVSFSGQAKGIVAILSGIFMIIMGLNMLNIFPWLKKLQPRMPRIFGSKLNGRARKSGPFYVGLLNGLMPCGPLQAMQLYALGTGAFITGALSMFFFSLGTVPLVFGLGAVSAFLSSRFTHRMVKFSMVLVIVLGVIMVNRGLNLSGFGVSLAAAENGNGNGNVAKIQNGVQQVTTTMDSGAYTPIIVQKGVPVRWTIRATDAGLNGCNNPVTIPSMNIQKQLVPGDNVIEFTPTKEGDIIYTCWMGMISSKIKVVADISNVSADDIKGASQVPANSGGCCSAMGGN